MSKINISQIKGAFPDTGESHQLLNTLLHNIDENSYDEIIRINNKVSSIIIWTDETKVLKIREMQLTRGFNDRITQIITTQYNDLGAAVETLTETINRECGKVSSITRSRMV